MATHNRGLLIVFEGIDGTGKSTQINVLKNFLNKEGYRVIATREPTNGQYGKQIRALYQDRQAVTRDEELALFISDRQEHVDTVIYPALRNGDIILCDRYFLSTAAYQGAAGIDPAKIIELNSFAPDPDLAFILEIDIVESMKRITISRGDVLNEFEQLESLKKVDKIFKSLQFPYIRRIDGSQKIQQVSKEIQEEVLNLLADKQTNNATQ